MKNWRVVSGAFDKTVRIWNIEPTLEALLKYRVELNSAEFDKAIEEAINEMEKAEKGKEKKIKDF